MTEVPLLSYEEQGEEFDSLPYAFEKFVDRRKSVGCNLIMGGVFLIVGPVAAFLHRWQEYGLNLGMLFVIAPIALLTLVVWALETLWIYLLVLAFGVTPSFLEAIFLTMVPVLASAFPLTPSGAGLVELTLFSCLRLVGVSSPLAASLTVVNRLIDYWFHIIVGVLTWAIRHVIGLRTWNEVPLESVESPDTMLREEAVRGG